MDQTQPSTPSEANQVVMKLENIFQYGLVFCADIGDYIGEKQQRHEAISVRRG